MIEPGVDTLEWAAGLFEGEGTVMMVRRRPHNPAHPRLALGMTDRDVVERFVKAIGFNRTIYVEPREKGHKTMYIVVYSGSMARDVIEMLLPFMGERRSAKMHHALVAR